MPASPRQIFSTFLIGASLCFGCAAARGTGPGAGESARTGTRVASAASRESGRSVQMGVASYYGGEHAGRRTASGERFDPKGMTAAHRTLPFGTRVRVTHLGNGRSVVVRINDRGPFRKSRIVDVSRAAAAELRMIGSGIAKVKLEVIGEVASGD